MTKTIIEKIYRFPFKGIPAQSLNETPVLVGTGIPLDRRYAITKGTVDTGKWMPARSFYINARTDGMSKFKLEQSGERFHITNPEGMTVIIHPDDADSLKQANEQMADFMRPVGLVADAPAPKLIDRKGKQSNWDYDDTPISIINAESVKEISRVLDVELDPLRFRGNLVVSGLPAWEEFSWMGKRIKIGTVEFEVHRPIDRCPTPGVNPENGERDVEVTPGIQEHFGHIHCGMYAKVVTDGKLQEGDAVEIIADADMNWTEAATENASRTYIPLE